MGCDGYSLVALLLMAPHNQICVVWPPFLQLRLVEVSHLQATMPDNLEDSLVHGHYTILWLEHYGTTKHTLHHIHSLRVDTQHPQQSEECNQPTHLLMV